MIGYDARRNSEIFARDTASVLAGAGLRVGLLPQALPTPVLAFAVRRLRAAAGIMVTASHNPREDNGYKVYLAAGSQLQAPADADISARALTLGPLASIPRSSDWDVLGEDVVAAYVDRVVSLVSPDGPRGLTTTYTPLHGIGGAVLLAAMSRAGFAAPHVVATQAAPDPDFPTVPFPNPEVPGVLDLALHLARTTGSDLVLANDPDADRLAVACGPRMLTGDEVGALLAVHLLRRHPGAAGCFVSSVVSSSLLARIADEAGVPYRQTLTGFKWIAAVPGLRYGYEEALGYCVDPDAVRDKDGIAAALLIAELAATEKAQGRTLLDVLDDLARQFGLYATASFSVPVAGPGLAGLMRRLRAGPPVRIGGRAVLAADDLLSGGGGLPPTDALRYRLAEHARVVVRPSGTEPTLKVYLEVVVAVAGQDASAAHAVAGAQLAALERDVRGLLGLSAGERQDLGPGR